STAIDADAGQRSPGMLAATGLSRPGQCSSLAIQADRSGAPSIRAATESSLRQRSMGETAAWLQR
ncbi:MAG: hypothetical protein KDH91_17160, partial [Rhodoferax sp.]|nr:hypothetical protein [Rhodoferax sp.]